MAKSRQAKVTGAFFDKTEHMVDKLEREIRRLDEAERDMADDNALDHAFNAALTGWHMIDWIQHSDLAPEAPTNKAGLNEYFIGECPQLGELHDITTRLKHITVSRPKSSDSLDVHASLGFEPTPSELIKLESGEYKFERIL